MQQLKKLRSLRMLVLLVGGISLLLFSLVFFFIFQTAIPSMLLRAETNYMTKQIEVISSALYKGRNKSFLMAEDLGQWEETARFVRGENPDYIKNNWPGESLLKTYGFHFIIIKDALGNDLYVEFFNDSTAQSFPAPTGFSQSLTPLTEAVLALHEQPASAYSEVHERGNSGTMLHDGVPYTFTNMPIFDLKQGPLPVGTITLGTLLDNNFFQTRTRYANSKFSFVAVENLTPAERSSIHRKDAKNISTAIPIQDINGKSFIIKMDSTRTIYMEGKKTLNRTTMILILAVLAFGYLVYTLIVRLALRPLEQLSEDISTISRDGSIDTEKYTTSKEFVALGTSINNMVSGLQKSKGASKVLQRILNGIDANVYVTDPETDEILFINTRMAEDYNISDWAIGKKCWKLLKKGYTGRCEFCPTSRLEKNLGSTLTWEEYSELSGKYYKNIDCMIQWTSDKIAHLQYSADITDSKMAEADLKKRLEQQELMSAISQNFISSDDSPSLISNALNMAGTFMNLSKILLARYIPDTQTLDAEYVWYNEHRDILHPENTSIPFHAGKAEYEAFITQNAPYLALEDVTLMPEFAYAAKDGQKSILGVPLMVGGEFWGILSFDECDIARVWTESDIHLTLFIGSVISGVISGSQTAEELIRMSSIADSSPQHITFITPEGNYKYINPGAVKLLGYSVEEFTKAGSSIIYDEDTYQRVQKIFLPQVLREGRSFFEVPIVRKNGETRIFSFCSFIVHDESVGVGSIAFDVTEERMLEQELVAAKNLAERSSQAKGEFLSRMSHEMRTPMNAIIGMTTIARDSADINKKEYCLEKIDNASKHLLGVINDILDMSKIEANKFELSYTDFDFEKMLMRVVNVVNFKVEEKHQTLIVNVDHAMPQALISDDQRLAQVLTNLLSNAVKFTPEQGTITLSTELLEEDNGFCSIKISVADTGIGISPAQQARLFQSFEQADGGIARRFGGTGLGLAISKNIVELMSGNIWIESEEGHGATFNFTIKAQRGSAARKSILNPGINWDNLHLLVVDDAIEVREYFLNLAETIGLKCDVSANGAEACAMVEGSPGKYNIIFVDWKMPEMDGIELTSRVKEKYGADIVVIMISASEWNDIEVDAKKAGVDRFIPKPLFSSLIVDCINECLGAQQYIIETLPNWENGLDAFAGHRILVAEDIDINQEIVQSLLQHTGITIDFANNGEEAWKMFHDAPETYDAIFMDIHMPEVDGYEATRRIRALDVPRATTIPIVAMTANVFREDIERCLAAGMNDHVGKPIDVEELFKKIAIHLKQSK